MLGGPEVVRVVLNSSSTRKLQKLEARPLHALQCKDDDLIGSAQHFFGVGNSREAKRVRPVIVCLMGQAASLAAGLSEEQGPVRKLPTVVVSRPDNISTTMLRKVASTKRDDTVWVPSRTLVKNGAFVAILEEGREGFTKIRTSGDVDGYIRSEYLHSAEPPLAKPVGTMHMTLYHGTDGANAASILGEGLRASTGGRLGAGVYLTDDKDAAKQVARHRGLQFVVTVDVEIGTVKDYGSGNTDAAWHGTFDVATAKHPPWAGVRHSFVEYCIADAKRVRVVRVEGAVAPQTGNPFEQPQFIVNVKHS